MVRRSCATCTRPGAVGWQRFVHAHARHPYAALGVYDGASGPVRTWYNSGVTQYQLRTDVFEGPLELLLTLIEKRKLLINDISLAEVADDYLKYLEQHPEFPVSETAQFVLVGSTLLLIKSKSLLPVLSFTEEEEASIEDLEVRLRLLERYKVLAGTVQERFGTVRLYGRRRASRVEPSFAPDASMTVDGFRDAMRAVLTQLPKLTEKLPQATVDKVISLEDMMSRLTQRISESMQVSFRDMTARGTQRVNVIVTFLAMLELVRQGVIRVEQDAQFGDIKMHADTVAVPRYT